jgi:hypothetical protein
MCALNIKRLLWTIRGLPEIKAGDDIGAEFVFIRIENLEGVSVLYKDTLM